jgi:hypothetical protein
MDSEGVAAVPTEGSTEISNETSASTSEPALPGQRPPWEGATSSVREPALGLDQQGDAHQSGPFTGLVAALKTVTAPRPVVPVREAPPAASRLLAICGWAALLDLAGVAIGIRGLVALLAHAPGWYLPSLLISGAAGIALTAGAFLSVRLRLIPWILLGGATAALICSAVFTTNAT